LVKGTTFAPNLKIPNHLKPLKKRLRTEIFGTKTYFTTTTNSTKNMRLFTFILTLATSSLFAQITDPKATEVWSPKPPVVKPGNGTKAPSDAIVLFDGTNLNEFLSLKDSSAAKWTLNRDSSMTVAPGTGDIFTKRSFGDCQLHVEFSTPPVVKGEAQLRGNSGVFLQQRYEVQVLDCYENGTYSNGQTASIYKQSIPLANVCRKPGEWQTYDIIYTAPRFNKDGIRTAAGYVTVLHNGVLVQNHTEIKGTTEYIGLPKNMAHGDAPLQLQDHGDLVRYRNIWIRPL
jgi:hypothetical protein